MNILVIDDDASIQYMLSEICEFAGWNSEIRRTMEKKG